jgi:hypothetical protein
MHRVIDSYLRQFVKEQEIEKLDESIQFEHFVNFCILSRYYPDDFEIEAISTSPDDESIDGVAVLIDDQLILTAEDAQSFFGKLPKRKKVSVHYFFFQAKREEGFDAGEILKFGSGVARLFDDNKHPLIDEYLNEIKNIQELVVKNLDKVDNGRPKCTLFYACTGVWNEGNNLRKQLDHSEKNLKSTGLFDEVTFFPVDRENLISYWNHTKISLEARFEIRGKILPFPPIKDVAKAYLTIAPVRTFIKDVLTGEDGQIRHAVFEQNVRAYLGDENPVNQRIRQSIEHTALHDQFSILNNGITIVAQEISDNGNYMFVRDFQIVNGCQTSHVLFRNQNLVSDNIYIPIKVIQTDDDTILSRIVEATNSQSDVTESQFMSIRPFARKLQVYFDSFEDQSETETRIYFERRTNQYAEQRIGQKRSFNIDRLARAYAAMFMDMPHFACRYPTQLVKEKANELYQPEHREIAYYTAALALYRLELALGNNYVDRKFQNYKWHLLMIIKYQSAGLNIPSLGMKKLDRYCNKILESLVSGGKGSVPIFLKAAQLIESLDDASRDRLKRQAYTTEILNRLRDK